MALILIVHLLNEVYTKVGTKVITIRLVHKYKQCHLIVTRYFSSFKCHHVYMWVPIPVHGHPRTTTYLSMDIPGPPHTCPWTSPDHHMSCCSRTVMMSPLPKVRWFSFFAFQGYRAWACNPSGAVVPCRTEYVISNYEYIWQNAFPKGIWQQRTIHVHLDEKMEKKVTW